MTSSGLLESCHRNETLYTILNLKQEYDLTTLRQWRESYRLEAVTQGLVVERMQDLNLLAKSQLSSLDIKKYEDLSADEIFRTDTRNFVRHLEILKEVLGGKAGLRDVATKLSNPADFLENMIKVPEQVTLKWSPLKQSTE